MSTSPRVESEDSEMQERTSATKKGSRRPSKKKKRSPAADAKKRGSLQQDIRNITSLLMQLNDSMQTLHSRIDALEERMDVFDEHRSILNDVALKCDLVINSKPVAPTKSRGKRAAAAAASS